MKYLVNLAFSATLLAAASGAQAALTVYDSQAAFLAAVSAPGVDGFDNLSTVGATATPWSGHAGAYSYTASATEFFGAGTSADPALSTNVSTDTITFANFGGGASAVGGLFFGSDISGVLAAGTLTLVATDAHGATLTRSITGTDTANFIGFISDGPMTSLTLTSVQSAGTVLWPSVDNFTLAVSAVPEPGVWLLLASGLGALGIATKRRRPGEGD